MAELYRGQVIPSDDDIFSAPPSLDEIKSVAPADDDIFAAPPTEEELAGGDAVDTQPWFPSAEKRMRMRVPGDNFGLSNPEMVALGKGMVRGAMTLPALPAEVLNLARNVGEYAAGTPWEETTKIADTDLAPFSAQAIADAWGSEGLGIYPERDADESKIERAMGTLGEFLSPSMMAKGTVAKGVVERMTKRGATPAQIAKAKKGAERAEIAAGVSGAAGAEIGTEVDPNSPYGRVIGGAVGSFVPSVSSIGGTAVRTVMRGGEKGRQAVQDAVQAAERASAPGAPINLTAGQAASKSGAARFFEWISANLPGGAPVFANTLRQQTEAAAQSVKDQVQRVLDGFNRRAQAENPARAASRAATEARTGRPSDLAREQPLPTVTGVSDETAGAAVRRGVDETIEGERLIVNQVENNFRRYVPDTDLVDVGQLVANLGKRAEGLPESPNVSAGLLRSPEVEAVLKQISKDAELNGGGVSFRTVRQVRKIIGEMLDGRDSLGLQPASIQGLEAVYGMLSETLRGAAKAKGPAAEQMWNAMQQFERELVARRERVFKPTVGRGNNTQTNEAIGRAIGTGDGSRISELLKAIPKEEADLAIANEFSQMGKATRGAQNAAGDAWSFRTFLTNLAAMRDRGLDSALFSRNPQLKQALDDLATVADRVDERARFLPNPSGSGRAVNIGTAAASIGAGVLNPLLGVGIAATTLVGPYIAARVLTSPRFVKWLAESARVPPASATGHIMRLGSMAMNGSDDERAAIAEFAKAYVDAWNNGDAMDRGTMVAGFVPGVGDIAQVLNDARNYVSGKLQATPANIGLTAMAVLPGVAGATELAPALKVMSKRNQWNMPSTIEALQAPSVDVSRKVGDVGKELEAATLKVNRGKPLDPYNDKDFDRIVQTSTAEARSQMDQADHGANWYDDDIKSAFELSEGVVPEFKDNEVRRTLMTVATAITSNGNRAAQNWKYGLQITEHFGETGRIPTRNTRSGQIFGVKGNTIAFQLAGLDKLIGMMGEAKAMEWLLTHHTVKELNEMQVRLGWKAGTVTGKAAERKVGALVFGPKVGRFMLNMNGVREVTLDSWMTRQWGRYTGTLTSGNNLDDQGLRSQPANTKEHARMTELVNRVADQLGVSPQSAQALLWYYEQRLYRHLGVKSARSESFADGARAEKAFREQAAAAPGAGSARYPDAPEAAGARGLREDAPAAAGGPGRGGSPPAATGAQGGNVKPARAQTRAQRDAEGLKRWVADIEADPRTMRRGETVAQVNARLRALSKADREKWGVWTEEDEAERMSFRDALMRRLGHED